MKLKIQRCITEINYILKYIKIENNTRKCNKISQCYIFFGSFDWIKLLKKAEETPLKT